MARDNKFSIEYPIVMLIGLLDKYDCTTGIVKKNGINISIRKIREEMNIHSFRMKYALDVLEAMNVLRVININCKKNILLNNKIVKRLQKGKGRLYE